MSSTSQRLEDIIYIGTYTEGGSGTTGSEGIYVCRLDRSTGMLSLVSAVGGASNPSFLALDPEHRHLYAVSEMGAGAVVAYELDPEGGVLTLLNRAPSGGSAPCHLSVDPRGRWVVVAHYGDGSVSVLPREAEGRVRPVAEVVQHVGASVNPERQEGPHAHQAIFGPDGAVLVADLGIDQVLAYALDEGTGELRPRGTPGVVQPGSGPRHMAFSRDGRFLYLLNELTYTVTVFAYDGAGLSPLQTVPMLPESFAGNSGADIHLTPDGAWLYASNRGHDSLARFAVNAVTGMLEPRGHTPTGGRTPRNFAVDPDGVFLLAANQDSGRVVVFRIDAATGELEETGGALDIPAPVCVLFARG